VLRYGRKAALLKLHGDISLRKYCTVHEGPQRGSCYAAPVSLANGKFGPKGDGLGQANWPNCCTLHISTLRVESVNSLQMQTD